MMCSSLARNFILNDPTLSGVLSEVTNSTYDIQSLRNNRADNLAECAAGPMRNRMSNVMHSAVAPYFIPNNAQNYAIRHPANSILNQSVCRTYNIKLKFN